MEFFDMLKTAYQKIAQESEIRPAGSQRTYLNGLPEPTDDLQRSFLQYKCQMHLAGPLRRAAYQCAAAVLLLIPRQMRTYASCAPADAVYAFIEGMDVLPNSLRREFSSLEHRQDYLNYFVLTKADREFLNQLRRRYPFAFYFRYKCLLKVGMYRAILDAYHPKALIVSGEYSFTSSVLTAYCQQLGVEHINVMHGEKLFHIRDSFFRFHRCYVWDDFYCRLFTRLRAEPTQFQTELPPAQLPWHYPDVAKTVDYTYYLQSESEAALRKIMQALQQFRTKGAVVAVRPHPRYTDDALVHELFQGFLIENKSEIGIEQSVLRTKRAISLYSTVLFQAYSNNVPIIIDDVSSPERYHRLEEMEYIMLHKPHTLLSEHLKEGNI